MEHNKEDEEEDGEPEIAVGEDGVDTMGHAIGVLLRTSLIAGLLQGAVDEAVLGVHDGRLGVGGGLLKDTGGCAVADGEELTRVGRALLVGQMLADIALHVVVVLKQFQGEIAGGIALTDVLVGLEVALDVKDAVLNLVAVVDVDMAVVAAGALIDLDDGAEEILDAHARAERGGHHGGAEESGQHLQVDVIATAFELVVHIEGADDAEVHVDKLGGQVEVALEVGGVDDVDHDVRHLLGQVAAHVELLGRIARKGVSAGQVDQLEVVAKEAGVGFTGVDGDTGVVAHMAMSARGIVEERCLAAIGVADEGDADGAVAAEGLVLQVVSLMVGGADVGAAGIGCLLDGRVGRDDLDERSLVVAQADLIAHKTILDGVLQRSVEEHLDALAPDEPHLDDALAETAVAVHLDDDALFACLQFGEFHSVRSYSFKRQNYEKKTRRRQGLSRF